MRRARQAPEAIGSRLWRGAGLVALAWAGGATLPPAVRANHLSGGEPDFVGYYAAGAIVLVFAGLIGALGLGPGRVRLLGRRLGPFLLVAGLGVLLTGAWQYARYPSPEALLGGGAWGRVAAWQIAGTTVVFSLFSAAVMLWAFRQGLMGFGEAAKYRFLQAGDPGDPRAAAPATGGAEHLVWIPLGVMAGFALFFVGAVAYVWFAVVRP